MENKEGSLYHLSKLFIIFIITFGMVFNVSSNISDPTADPIIIDESNVTDPPTDPITDTSNETNITEENPPEILAESIISDEQQILSPHGTHTATVTITPDLSRCDQNHEFKVTVEHTGGDPIKEVRIYDGPFDSLYTNIPPHTNFLCGPAPSGWILVDFHNFGFPYCTYVANTSNDWLEYGEFQDFNFSATLTEESNYAWGFETYDIDLSWLSFELPITVDCSDPITKKTFNPDVYTKENEFHGGTIEWISLDTLITLNAIDPDPHPSGINKTWWRNFLAPDSICTWPKDQCNPEFYYQSNYTDPNAPWNEYTGPFYKEEESCHILEFYSTDNIGNVEDLKVNCFFVDDTPPVVTKEVGNPKLDPNLEELGNGDATWSTLEKFLDQNSAKLTIPDEPSSGDFAGVDSFFDVFVDLSSINSLTYDVKVTQGDKAWLPLVVFGIDADNDGVYEAQPLEWQASGFDPSYLGDDSFIQCENEIPIEILPLTLTGVDAYNKFKCYTPNVAGDNYESVYQPLIYFQSNNVARIETTDKVAMVKVHLGGNPSTQDNEIAYVDNVILNGKVIINEPNWYITQETPIAFTCEDQEPHPSDNEKIYYRYSVNDGAFTDWILYEEPFTFEENSKHTLEYYCEDAVGNKAGPYTEIDKVDNEPPVIKKEMFGSWSGDCPPNSENVDDKCYVADNGESGVSVWVQDPNPEHAVDQVKCKYEVIWNDIEPITVESGEFDYNVNITFKEDSTHELKIYCEDALGNSVEDTETFLVDSTPPETSKKYGNPFFEGEFPKYCQELDNGYQCGWAEWINSTTPISLEATDEKVGVDKTYWRNLLVNNEEAGNLICGHLSGNEIQDYCNPEFYNQYVNLSTSWNVYTEPFNKTEESCHIIEYYSVDKLNNTEKVKWQCVFVDNSYPNVTKDIGEPKVIKTTCEEEPEPEEELPENHNSPGDNLRQIEGAYSQPCSINTGLAFDGTNLLITCWYHNVIDVLSPADGSLQGTITVPGYNGLNAAAWDATRNKLWACAEHNKVILVDTSDGSSTFMFTATDSCTDGLAYDGTDDTLYTSGDVHYGLYHYNTDGTLIEILDMTGKLGDYGNSGIAVGGDKLYLANDGGSQIYEATKDLSSSTLFATFPERLEDMECDDITFAGQGVGAIWSQDAYDRIINAYEIPQGQCGFGGLPPEPKCEDKIVYITQETPIELSCKDVFPHPVDHVSLWYRFRVSDDCENWNEWSDWIDPNGYEVEKTIYFKEDSCHELEYYCTDGLGNQGPVLSEIDIVDTKAPVINKTIIGPYTGTCPPDVENEEECIIDGVTKIHVNAYDPEPHPVNDVTCRWGYTVNGGDFILGGQGLGSEFDVNFPEESEHNLIIECKDALGNKVHDEEIFTVDKTPPVTKKAFEGPQFPWDNDHQGSPHWITNTTQVILRAYDPEPHPSGVNVTYWRNTLVDDEACNNTELCQETRGSGDWNVYQGPFNKTEQSCHLIEYFSVDNVNKTEEINKQCVYVDLTPPTPIKVVGDPKSKWEGENTFYPNLTDRCWSNDPSKFIECWKITLDTPISMSCVDPEPHPVNHENICYRVDLDGKDFTQQYCNDYFPGEFNETGDGFCCLQDTIDDFTFGESSQHELEFYCEDALGNRGPTDIEKFKVEGEPFNITINKKWNLISVPVVLLNDSIEEVLGDYDFIKIVWAYDAATDTWYVYSNDGIDWNDDLHALTPGWGYWVLATDDGMITIGGSLLSPKKIPPSRELVEGWNLIGYYGTDGLPGYYGPFEDQNGDPIDAFGGGKRSYCGLYTLTNPVSPFNPTRWSSLYTYWEPTDEGFLGLGMCQHMAPGAGYWIQMDEDDLYAPTESCPEDFINNVICPIVGP